MNEWARLDDAWSEAVRLPDGWRLRSLNRDGTEVEYVGGRREYVEWWEATARGSEDEEITEVGSWPVHALHELVEAVTKRVSGQVSGQNGPEADIRA